MDRNIFRQLAIILIITVLSSGMAMSQSIGKPVESKAIQEFFDLTYKIDPRLISGDLYQPTISISGGHPFFLNPDWKKGSVVIDGIQFDNLLLRYDISSNKLLLNTRNITSLNLQLILKINNISYFKMDDHSFRTLPGKNKFYDSYFCEVLAQGEINLFLLRSKKLKIIGSDLNYSYQTNQFEYLVLNEKVFRYRGRRTLFKLLPELKTELRDFIKTNRLRYRAIKHDDLVKLINHSNVLLEEK